MADLIRPLGNGRTLSVAEACEDRIMSEKDSVHAE